MKKLCVFSVIALLCIAAPGFAANALLDPGFDSPGDWYFQQFNGAGSGTVSGSQAHITITGNGGEGGTLSDEIPTSGNNSLIPGQSYTITVDRNYTALGASAVAELHVGTDPALSGSGDYPGSGASLNILKDDCWGSACGSTGGMNPMPQGGTSIGNPQTYPGGTLWFVIKASGWGPGTPQTVDFDNGSVEGVLLDVSDWMLY